MSIFTGSAVALITPFRNGAIDYQALERIIELQIAAGSDAIVALGTTAEASTLSSEEREELTRFIVERVLIAHYSAIAEQVRIPIIAYNVPSRTGLNLLPETMRKMMDSNENIIGIKEASGNIEQIVKLAALCPDCDLYAGNDDHVVPMLSVGAKGVISTVANIIPEVMHLMCKAFFDGNTEEAKRLQLALLPIQQAAFCEVNPIPIKTMMGILKLCDPEVRLPLIKPSLEHYEYMERVLKEAEML